VAPEYRAAEIHYLFHSGFAVETGDFFLIFDYFPHQDKGDEKEKIAAGGNGLAVPYGSVNVSSGSIGKGEAGREGSDLPDGVVTPESFNGRLRPYVFASHGHWDHFSPCILDWYKANSNIRYVLSSDILKKISRKHRVPKNSIIIAEPYQTIKEEGLTIKTFGSTDVGVSFLIEANGLGIFHAGDLNWWHWADESTAEELMDEEARFKREIGRLTGERVDIAFFPVDPRLGRHYCLGGEYFIKTLRPGVFFPMHFAEHHNITQKFADEFSTEATRVIAINRRGQRTECFFP